MTDVTESTTNNENTTPENSNSEVEALRQELSQSRELIKNLRKYEKSYKDENEKALAEQGKYKELFETERARADELSSALKNTKIESVINDLIKSSGAKNSKTVQRLIDKSAIQFAEDGSVETKSIQSQLVALQKEAPELFGLSSEETPAPKKPSGDTTTLTFEAEVAKCKTQKELDAVLAKYGK